MKIMSLSIGDYIDSVRDMPHDAERLYLHMLLWMYSRERFMVDSDKENAKKLGYDPRQYKRLKAIILNSDCGLYVKDGELRHTRVGEELAKVAERKAEAAANGAKGGRPKKVIAEDRPDLGETSGELPGEVQEKLDGSCDASHMQQQAKTTTYEKLTPTPTPTPKESIVAQARENAEGLDFRKIALACQAAGGAALNRSSGSLEAIPEPLAWIDGGADLERDILPTIRRIAERTRPGKIKTWGYFNDAVLEAMAKRKATTAAFGEVKSADVRALEVMQKQPVVRAEPILNGVFG